MNADFSSVLNLTIKDVEEQLGATEAQLRTMDMEEVLKQLYNSTTLETLPSFMRTLSWQQHQQQAEGDKGAGGAAPPQQQPAAAPNPAAWEAAAAAGAAAAGKQAAQQAAATQQQQQVAAAAAAAASAAQHAQQAQQAAQAVQQQQAVTTAGLGLAPLPGGGMLPLSSVRMDQIFSWYAENAGGQGQKSQLPLPSMTLSQLFDTAGLHLAQPGLAAAQPQLQQGALAAHGQGAPTPPPLHPQLGLGLSGGMHSLQAHAQASLLPPGLSPAGPFASGPSSLPVPPHPGSLPPPSSLAPPSDGGKPPRGEAAAAARAARARKRKDMATAPAGAPAAKAAAGGLSAAEAARQAREVAERAAAELAELPQDLDDKEARAMKRAIKNRESAARSRAKRQEYTATLEQQVEQLKQQNNQLRKQVITTAVAPPDPHAPKHDGELLRRSRTGPI